MYWRIKNMNESERLQRWKDNYGSEECVIESATKDEKVANRIAALLNHPQIDKYCVVDAYYYDFSVIPRSVQEKLQLWCDAYLIFGITTEGEMISKWIGRWDLDSTDPIVDGNVIHSERSCNDNSFVVPEIRNCFDPQLLSTPAPDFIKTFRGS